MRCVISDAIEKVFVSFGKLYAYGKVHVEIIMRQRDNVDSSKQFSSVQCSAYVEQPTAQNVDGLDGHTRRPCIYFQATYWTNAAWTAYMDYQENQ